MTENTPNENNFHEFSMEFVATQMLSQWTTLLASAIRHGRDQRPDLFAEIEAESEAAVEKAEECRAAGYPDLDELYDRMAHIVELTGMSMKLLDDNNLSDGMKIPLAFLSQEQAATLPEATREFLILLKQNPEKRISFLIEKESPNEQATQPDVN